MHTYTAVLKLKPIGKKSNTFGIFKSKATYKQDETSS